jgi:predicted heme/steroid binding protein
MEAQQSLSSGADAEKIFTERELQRYNGEDEPMYVAYQGIVYDVSQCPKWRRGMHENLHYAGLDLSGEMTDAPHQQEVFQRPCVKRVGRLSG